MLTKIVGGLAGIALGVGAFTFCNLSGGMCPLGGMDGSSSPDTIINARPVAAMTSTATGTTVAEGDTCCPHGDKPGSQDRTPVINAAFDMAINTEVTADEASLEATGKTCPLTAAKMAKQDCESTADCQPGVDCPLEKATDAFGMPVANLEAQSKSADYVCDSTKADCEPGDACPMSAPAKVAAVAPIADASSDACSAMPCCKDEKATPVEPAANLTTASAATE